MMIRAALLAMALVLVSDVFANDYNGDAEIGSYKRKMEELAELIPYETYQKVPNLLTRLKNDTGELINKINIILIKSPAPRAPNNRFSVVNLLRITVLLI